MSDRIVKLGIVGLGPRGETLLGSIFEMTDEIQVTAICDTNVERVNKILGIFDKHNCPRPVAYTNYRQLIASPEVEAILSPTSWNSHLKIARDAMEAGKYAGIEVGGASDIQELWELVQAAEKTGVSCMMLENCCYGRNELMVLNMVRQGLFGELIYCECGYEHDLSDYAWQYPQMERMIHNQYRNCDLYPTHGIGPIAKILRINRGNRFLSLSSFATKGRGFTNAAKAHGLDTQFNIGDIVTTVIKCANGENVTLTHGISLPRPYSRDCRVQGTKGIWLENARGIYIEGISTKREEIDIAGNPYTVHDWDDQSKFYQEYDHPIWREFCENQIGGHGGMDALTLRAFCDAVRRRATLPIDVYDVATWMAITALSEASIATGSAPVPFPDFTKGAWMKPIPQEPSKWNLDEVCE